MGASFSAEVAVDYLGVIKPVLKERCYSCHGALKQKAGLRLDTAEAIRRGSDEGAIVDLVNPEASRLLERITQVDAEERMPPEGKPLKPEAVDAIRNWIRAGAPLVADEKADDDPRQHWAFQRIERPPLPAGGPANPIDAFLAAKQNEEGLVAQPEAERAVQIRRLYLDVIGLPPTREQLRDTRPWDEIVDDLLESPQHGERWGRHWMDIWRYSDWFGLGKQLRHSQKHIWHWRDWIVESLNADKGYDRMIQEMLAGDELAPDDLQTVRATGFLARNYYLFNRTTWLDNTIEHTGKAFLGLTMNCAKCHDHKYDPIEQTDYYRFRAIFEPHQVRLDEVPGESDLEKNGIPRVFDEHLEAPTWVHRRGDAKDPDKTNSISPGVPVLFAAYAPKIEEVPLPYEAWVPGARKHVQDARLAGARERVAEARRKLEEVEPGKKPERPAEDAEENVVYEIDEPFDGPNEKLWKVEGDDWEYRDGALHKTRADRENKVVSTRTAHPRDFEVTCRYTVTSGTTYKSVGVRFDRVEEGRNQHQVYTSAHEPEPKVQVMHTVDGKDQYPPKGKVQRPIKVGETYELKFAVRDRLLNVWLDGEFLLAYELPIRHADGRIAITGFDAVVAFDSLRLRALPADYPLQPAGAGKALTPEAARAELRAAEEALAKLEATIAVDRARAAGRAEPEAAGPSTYVPLRASRKALESPEHKFEQYGATYPETSSGRRTALARWITHRDNPLTARVAVNHIWLRHFGEPLVESVFDFGRRAKEPYHRELLDYLSVELMESGWSMRHLHRLMVTSEAYRRTSTTAGAAPGNLERDPANRCYWRMNARRMESEVIRDSLLHLGGVLDVKMGGPSIDPKEGGRRRSLYFLHSRDQKDKFLGIFDHADHLRCYRRSESVVPQQALALSNSRLALEMAEEMAGRFGNEAEGLAQFVEVGFESILGRRPERDEVEACLEFCASLEATGLSEGQSAVRSRLIHALLNHNDFVTIR